MYDLHPAYTNTLVGLASSIEQPQLRPPRRSVPQGVFQQIPLVTFLLARCRQVLRQMFPLSLHAACFLSFPVPPCQRPASLFFSLFFLKAPQSVIRKKKNISYLCCHCQVSMQENPCLQQNKRRGEEAMQTHKSGHGFYPADNSQGQIKRVRMSWPCFPSLLRR